MRKFIPTKTMQEIWRLYHVEKKTPDQIARRFKINQTEAFSQIQRMRDYHKIEKP